MNFPYPLVILKHWRDLDATLKHIKREKKAFGQGLNGGKRSRRKNAKIPEVVKVNNYQNLTLAVLQL
jgi:hypothetical protein